MTSNCGWGRYFLGMHIEWPFSFSEEQLNIFAQLSGDFNPIHHDANFAKDKGFPGPLIYGILLSSQASRLIGQELPDKNLILTSISLDFMNPAFPGDELIFSADLIAKSDALNFLEFSIRVLNGEKAACRGKVTAVWRA